MKYRLEKAVGKDLEGPGSWTESQEIEGLLELEEERERLGRCKLLL